MIKKIFIGTNNIASVVGDISKGFNNLGIKTLTGSRFPDNSPIIAKSEDFNAYNWKSWAPKGRPNRITIPIRKWWEAKVDRYFLDKAMHECDAFLFISESFYEDHSDLKILKDAGKKIFFVFVGDDVRWYHAMKQEFQSYGLKPMEYDQPDLMTFEALKRRVSKIRTVEKYADFVFSRLDQAQLQLRPYYRWNMMVRSEKFICDSKQQATPIIAHAPSYRAVKGTKYVLKALEDLKKEGLQFNLKLIENVPHREALAMYAEADIMIDQLLCPGAGKLSTEAMAMGRIVVSNMSYDKYPQQNPDYCPIIDADPDTIYDVLKGLILDYDFRVDHAKQGRPYVEKHLDVLLFCQRIVQLNDGESVEYDYFPSFFRNAYEPASPEETNFLNQEIMEVKGEEWYSRYVKPGIREGIKF